MDVYRRYARRYRRFRQQSRLHVFGCTVVELAAGIALVYQVLAPLVCRSRRR